MLYKEKALKHLRKSLELNPSLIEANIFQIEFFLNEGKIDDAKRQVLSSLSHSPDNSQLFFLKSLIEFKKRQFSESASSIEKALEFSPDNIQMLQHSLSVYEQHGDLKQKLTILQKLIELVDDKPEYYLEIASIQYNRGLLEDAKVFFDLALDFLPEDENCLIKVSRFYFECYKDLKDANHQEVFSLVRTLMKRVLSLNKTNYESKLILAEIHLKEEDIESAYLLLKECFTYNYKRRKYLLKIHELGSLLEGFDISRKYVSQSLSQTETEGIANYLEAKNYFKSKNEKCIECAIVAIRCLRRDLRKAIKSFHRSTKRFEFYSAKKILEIIDSDSHLISQSYLIYYQFNLHQNRRLVHKALKSHIAYKEKQSID